jgi:hypothetical protein
MTTSGTSRLALSPKLAPSNLDFEIPSQLAFDFQSAMPSHQVAPELQPYTGRNELRVFTVRPSVNFTFPSSYQQETCHQLSARGKLQTNAIQSGSMLPSIFQQKDYPPQMSFASPGALPIALGNPNLLSSPFVETISHQQLQTQQQQQPPSQHQPHPQSQSVHLQHFPSQSNPQLQNMIYDEAFPSACFVAPERGIAEYDEEESYLCPSVEGNTHDPIKSINLMTDKDSSLVMKGDPVQYNSQLQDSVSEEAFPSVCFPVPKRQAAECIKEDFVFSQAGDENWQGFFERLQLITDTDSRLIVEGDL